MNVKPYWGFWALLIFLLLSFAACGGGGNTSSASTPVNTGDGGGDELDTVLFRASFTPDASGSPSSSPSAIRPLAVAIDNLGVGGTVTGEINFAIADTSKRTDKPFWMYALYFPGDNGAEIAVPNSWQPLDAIISSSAGYAPISFHVPFQPIQVGMLSGSYYDNSPRQGAGSNWNFTNYDYYGAGDPFFSSLRHMIWFCIDNNQILPGTCTATVRVENVSLLEPPVLGADFKWTYKLGLLRSMVPGSPVTTQIMGDWNGWALQTITDSDNDGKYELSYTGFDRDIRFVHGDLTGGHPATITDSVYYNSATNQLEIGLSQGQLYTIPNSPNDNAIFRP